MKQAWIVIVVAVAVALVLLPGPALAGVDCWSRGGCGEVQDGLDSHLSTNPVNWKCVKADFAPMYPGMPVCQVNMIEMKKPVRMPITFGAPATRGAAQTK